MHRVLLPLLISQECQMPTTKSTNDFFIIEALGLFGSEWILKIFMLLVHASLIIVTSKLFRTVAMLFQVWK